jgi:hypothetical protein
MSVRFLSWCQCSLISEGKFYVMQNVNYQGEQHTRKNIWHKDKCQGWTGIHPLDCVWKPCNNTHVNNLNFYSYSILRKRPQTLCFIGIWNCFDNLEPMNFLTFWQLFHIFFLLETLHILFLKKLTEDIGELTD